MDTQNCGQFTQWNKYYAEIKKNELVVHSTHGQVSEHCDEQKKPDTRVNTCIIPNLY